jgi:hypothetical protein
MERKKRLNPLSLFSSPTDLPRRFSLTRTQAARRRRLQSTRSLPRRLFSLFSPYLADVLIPAPTPGPPLRREGLLVGDGVAWDCRNPVPLAGGAGGGARS